MTRRLIVLLVAAMLVWCGALFAEEWIGSSAYTDIQTPHPYPRAEQGAMVWSYTIHETGAAWIKPHFSDFKLNDGDYVELVDMYGMVIETVKGAEIENETRFNVKNVPVENKARVKNPKKSFWGPAIDGDEVTVKLYRDSRSRKGYGFSIDEVGIGIEPISEEPVIESICGSDTLQNIKCQSTAIQNLGLAVGRMLYQKSGSWYVCTGFLVSSCSSHFLTNEHCISSQTDVNTLQVRFRYRYTTCTGSTLDSYSTYYGSSFVTDNTYYDFCLLTLSGSPQNTYGHLGLINGNPVSNEAIYIIQHPGGYPQKFGSGTVYSTSAYSGRDFSYYVDTRGGSSGSPVFADYEDEVLGLHHYGGCPNSAVKMNYIYEYIIGYICN
jgi:serine protease